MRPRTVMPLHRRTTAIKLRNRTAERWMNGRGIAPVSWPFRPLIANVCYPCRCPGLSPFRTFGARNRPGRYLLAIADYYFGHGYAVFFVNLMAVHRCHAEALRDAAKGDVIVEIE